MRTRGDHASDFEFWHHRKIKLKDTEARLSGYITEQATDRSFMQNFASNHKNFGLQCHFLLSIPAK